MSELLYCRDENPQVTGQPLVLIHGLFGASENLLGIARAFTDRPVCLVDLRNHGRSFHADTMSFTAMAADIIALLDAKGWSSVDVLGHSLGGKVGLQLAQSYPQRVRRLIVADIAPVLYQPHHQLILQALDAVDPQQVKSRSEAEQILREYLDDAGVRGFLLMNLTRAEQGGYQWRCNIDAFKACYDSIRRPPEFVQAFNGATLYIRGGVSDYVLAEHEAEIRRYTPVVTIATLEGCGHWLHAEKPAEFNALARDFLN